MARGELWLLGVRKKMALTGHPTPARLTSSSSFSQLLPPLLSLGKGRGRGDRENPVNTAYFFLHFFFFSACFFPCPGI